MICTTRSRMEAAGGRSRTRRPLCSSRKARDGIGRAYEETTLTMERNSASPLRRNFRRAGTFSKSSRTVTVVPRSRAAGITLRSPVSGSKATVVACPLPPSKVVIEKRDTLAIEGSASPRKPSVRTRVRSSNRADLRGGVALQRQHGVALRHPAAVVADLDELPPAVLEQDVDGPGTCVDGVLDELLDHRSGALDDLSGCDLVDELGGEDMDRRHVFILPGRVRRTGGRRRSHARGALTAAKIDDPAADGLSSVWTATRHVRCCA